MSAARGAGAARRAAACAFAWLVATHALAATPLHLKPASSFDAWQIALKAVLIGAMAVGAVAGGLYAWRSWRRSQGLIVGDSEAAAVEWARRVSPRTTLLVVKWSGKRYLLAENTAQTVLLDSRPLDGATTP